MVATVVPAALVLVAVVALTALVLVDEEPPPHAESNIIDTNTTQPINRVFTSRPPFTDAPTGCSRPTG
jgi:hypothetical protein